MHVDSPPILRAEPQRTRSFLSPQTSWQQWGSMSHGQSPPTGGRRAPLPAGKWPGLPSARCSGGQRRFPVLCFHTPLLRWDLRCASKPSGTQGLGSAALRLPGTLEEGGDWICRVGNLVSRLRTLNWVLQQFRGPS